MKRKLSLENPLRPFLFGVNLCAMSLSKEAAAAGAACLIVLAAAAAFWVRSSKTSRKSDPQGWDQTMLQKSLEEAGEKAKLEQATIERKLAQSRRKAEAEQESIWKAEAQKPTEEEERIAAEAKRSAEQAAEDRAAEEAQAAREQENARAAARASEEAWRQARPVRVKEGKEKIDFSYTRASIGPGIKCGCREPEHRWLNRQYNQCFKTLEACKRYSNALSDALCQNCQ
jgi:hypothetical protein